MNTSNLKHHAASTLIAMGMGSTAALAEPTLEIGGAVEVEINSGKDHTASKGSDIALATVELGFDAQINENVSAHILILHEGDADGAPVIDEGVISITNGSMFFNAGRMYVPFGDFESNMISDPLTLEIAETQEVAIQLGFATGGLHASIYAFNGGADKNEVDSDVIDDFGISLSYSMESDSTNLDVGFDFINNMAETDGIEGALGGALIAEHTAGIALHAIINIDNLALIIEHVTSADDFNTADISFNGEKASPSASNIEVAYTMNMGRRDLTIAVAAQSTADVDPSAGLPESRTMLSVSTTIAGNVGLGVEFANASDYETADGGSGESGGMFTAQLAVEF